MSRLSMMTSSQDSIHSLLLPLADSRLLVPSVAVAELLAQQVPQALAGQPEWVLGQIEWRGLLLPLLSFECACGQPLPRRGKQACIAVLNAQGGRPHVKFLALQLQGIPQALRVDASLARSAQLPVQALDQAVVALNDLPARIPDLEKLENQLLETGLI